MTGASGKAALRHHAEAARARLHADAGTAAAALAAHGTRYLAQRPGIIAGYWPIGTEIDCRPLMEALAAAGRTIALPVVATPNAPLAFRLWVPGMALERGPHGTMAPPEAAASAAPDILLIPMLGFDGKRHRLGYGAGYYDRTIASLRPLRPILAIGVAYAGQEMDALPADTWDERLDTIVTEAGVM